MTQRRATWYALSAAASVAAVAAVGWVALPLVQPAGPQIASAPPAVVQTNAQNLTPVLVPVAQGVGDYVLAHQRYSPRTAMAGVLPYVGSVGDDAGRR